MNKSKKSNVLEKTAKMLGIDMPDIPQPDRFISFAEVAEMLGLRETTVRNGECGTDELIRIKLGKQEGTIRFSLNDVQAWMLRQARKALETHQWQEEAVREYLTKIGKARRSGGKKIVKEAIQTLINGGFEYESEPEEDRQQGRGEEEARGAGRD
ncbi:MAG TPA: hypothetical protein VFV58_12605 [Blastocatellia bacterium]|jgi:predicted DNA-binding transcriptional regulator AlpA|nr:hypothetical protein [Blastocatellia bacterium]